MQHSWNRPLKESPNEAFGFRVRECTRCQSVYPVRANMWAKNTHLSRILSSCILWKVETWRVWTSGQSTSRAYYMLPHFHPSGFRLTTKSNNSEYNVCHDPHPSAVKKTSTRYLTSRQTGERSGRREQWTYLTSPLAQPLFLLPRRTIVMAGVDYPTPATQFKRRISDTIKSLTPTAPAHYGGLGCAE